MTVFLVASTRLDKWLKSAIFSYSLSLNVSRCASASQRGWGHIRGHMRVYGDADAADGCAGPRPYARRSPVSEDG